MASLRQLQYFCVLAETLHFTRAAARLGIAQPPLSQSIRALEEEIGCELIRRRPALRLTEAGAMLLEHARRILRDFESSLDEVKGVARGHGGRLRIGFASSTLAGDLPRILRLFRDEYPAVQVELRGCRSAAQGAELLAGSIDIGIMREAPDSPEIARLELSSEAFVLVAPADFTVGRSGVRLCDLRQHEFILFPAEAAPALRRGVDRLFQEAGFQPRVAQLAREWFTIVGLVEAGGGLSIVPSSFTKLRWGDVRYVPLIGSAARTVASICHLSGNASPTVANFLEIARRVRAGPTRTASAGAAE
jgi:DNA-binding transcriptional LysR family regulator